MSWASEAIGAIRKIVLLEDRMERLASQVDALAQICGDLDRRFIRLEAKFELIEKMGASSRSPIGARSRRHKDTRKTD
ncbi:MAG TPA: hypothetical protein VFN26_23080 [Candidatus Acidoferrum sp.]|nr:hypothetical protein [Candidatus Acidoferrum sp.]